MRRRGNAPLMLVGLFIGLATPVFAEDPRPTLQHLQDENRVLRDRLEAQEARLRALEEMLPVEQTTPRSQERSLGEHSLYGRLRFSMTRVHTDTGSLSTATDSQDENSHFIGIRGAVGDGALRALYDIQFSIDGDTRTPGDVLLRRLSYAGFESDRFGRVLYGTMDSPYKLPGIALDPFYNTPNSVPGGSHHFGLSALNSGWIADTVSYTSPEVRGLRLAAALFKDGQDNPDDGWSLGLDFDRGPLRASFHVLEATEETGFSVGDLRATRGTLAYAFSESLRLGASWEHLKPKLSESIDLYFGSLRYPLTQKLTFGAAIGFVDGGVNEGIGVSLGSWYSVLPNTQIYAVAGSINQRERLGGASDRRSLGIGVHHAFSLGD